MGGTIFIRQAASENHDLYIFFVFFSKTHKIDVFDTCATASFFILMQGHQHVLKLLKFCCFNTFFLKQQVHC